MLFAPCKQHCHGWCLYANSTQMRVLFAENITHQQIAPSSEVMMQYVIWVIKTSLSFDIMRMFDSILKFESYDLMGNFVRVLVNITLFYPQEDVNIIQLLIRSNYAPYSWKFLRPSGHFLTDQIPPYFWVICVSLSAFKTGLSGKQHPWLGCLLETA